PVPWHEKSDVAAQSLRVGSDSHAPLRQGAELSRAEASGAAQERQHALVHLAKPLLQCGQETGPEAVVVKGCRDLGPQSRDERQRRTVCRQRRYDIAVATEAVKHAFPPLTPPRPLARQGQQGLPHGK